MDEHAQHQQQPLAPAGSGDSHMALLLERWVAAAGAVLVVASLGYLLYQGLLGDHSPPDIAITVDAIDRSGADYLVRFTAANNGSETAAQVRIVGTLTPAAGPPEEAEVTLDYIPGRSSATGGLFFRGNPGEDELELRATGYQNP
ncbi:MAG: hypothetical protein RBS88_11855 [Spongiibacteraceae bacterium]|jgi:uncharacterized protein (TIGR02588 family)|nr:hypothetical protein [Spongiibacteraceae bacterium]